MNWTENIVLALASLWANKMRSLLTLLGVIVGIASVITILTLGASLQAKMFSSLNSVGINDINPTSAAAPFGGVKESGLGREGAQEGILEYLDTKLVGISIS